MAVITPEERVRIETATAWRPEPGDTITGTVVTIRARETEYGKHPVVILNTGEENYTAVHAFHGVLKNKLFELKPGPGTRLTVGYQGKVDGKERPYHSYTAFDPDASYEAEEFNWDDDPEF